MFDIILALIGSVGMSIGGVYIIMSIAYKNNIEQHYIRSMMRRARLEEEKKDPEV